MEEIAGRPEPRGNLPTDEELKEYWAWYGQLPFREKIREDGIVGWLLHTNTGVVLALAAQLVVVIALVWFGVL